MVRGSGARWPDFFIIGAARSGTTSLWHYLRQHPDIFMCPIKETHYFGELEPRTHDAIGRPMPATIITDEPSYLALFRGAKEGQLIGEASVSYLVRSLAPLRIREKNPQAKIIAVLREPVSRAYSSWLLGRREGTEVRGSFWEALMEDYRCLELQPEDSRYIGVGFYARHLKRWFSTFGRDQVRVFLFDDLLDDTSSVVREICEFLGVPWYGGKFFNPRERLHQYGEPRGRLARIVLGNPSLRALVGRWRPFVPLAIRIRDRLINPKAQKPPIDPRVAAFLRGLYKDDILELQELIGRDLSHWLRDQ